MNYAQTKVIRMIAVHANAYAVCALGTCPECDVLRELRDMALKALAPNNLPANMEVKADETTREMIDRDVCPSCTWRGDVELDNGVCPYCHTDWDKLLDEDEERADNG